jgi:L-ascorbate metabolism protein UlaG (beta-lactamase superfamily)
VSVSLRWLGHSTVLIELDSARFVTDPVLRKRVLHLRRQAAAAAPEVDAILVSHQHYDHLDIPSLAAIGVDVPVVVPRGAGKMLRGFEQVIEVEPGSTLELAGIAVRVVEARHDGRRRNVGASLPAVGYVLEGTSTIYFAGDTDLFDGMRSLGEIDVALLPVWGWGSKVGEGHLDPERAASALSLLEPRVAIPIHWGTYTTLWSRGAGQAPADEFALAALQVAPAVDVRVLPVGGGTEV